MVDLIVVGSLNMDLVVRTPRFPQPGETIQGQDLATYPGGKGANQAVAAAKHGLEVAMIGKVGQDTFGDTLLETLPSKKVDTTHITTDPQASTGTAVITVNQKGQNSIVLSAGANARLTPADIDRAGELFEHAAMFLVQFEIPSHTVAHAVEKAHKAGLQVLVNPAPGREIDRRMMGNIDILIPNESELSLLSGQQVRDLPSAEEAGRRLQEMGIPTMIITLGHQGCLVLTESTSVHLAPPQVEVVDTTAAGDSFIGGFAAALRKDFTLQDAAAFANCAGALATTKPGAQPSLPTFEEVQTLYQETRNRHE